MGNYSLISSKRGKIAPYSPIRKFVPYLEEAKKKGIEVFEIHIGQPDLSTPKEILKNLRNFKGERLVYTNSLGPEELRKAWQKYFQDNNIHFELSEIIATIAGSEAILFAICAVCDPGEKILTFEPMYPNYLGYAVLAGITLEGVRLLPEKGYHLPPKKEIEKKIDKKTRAILFSNPNNPTGTVFTRQEIETIVKIAKKHNIFILSDETYREFVYDGKKHYSPISFPDGKDRTIILESVSKKFSACGARIGCLACKNKEIIEAVAKFAQARLSLPEAEAMAVIPLLKNSKKYTTKVAKEYKKRRDTVFSALKKIAGVFCLKPEGAFYIMVKLPVDDSEKFSKWLLTDFSYNKKTVMVAPGAGFYLTKGLGNNEVRIAFVLSSEKLKEAIALLKIALEKYQNENL